MYEKKAFRLFAEQGYANVQMKDIAIACDISKSLLQHYFPKKIVLLSTMLNELTLSAFIYSNEQLTMLSSYQRTMIQMSFVLRINFPIKLSLAFKAILV
ncbi:hypothetical protein WP50_05990 [Lactiplantibacillus plantarum]|nr:hypothetical protein WP50_05990 [Lactiplantibacillus plantarum]